MKITNLFLLAAAPITAMTLPANVTHAAQSDAPVPANHHDRNVKIGVGCIGAAFVVGLIGVRTYSFYKLNHFKKGQS